MAALPQVHVSEEEPMSPRMLQGACYCGAVSYEVEDDFLYAAICHCSRCRRATGAASKPFAGIAAGKLRLTGGEADLLIVGELSGPHDVRCRHCGSLLYSDLGERAHVALGSLVDAPSIRPTEHIFVGSKAPWEIIADDLPQRMEFE
jgi:hypothetical protein